ncbi:MAG TPA: vWA domain-containing protein [Gammaproteobacteria bacterium]|nr:vWA domain-containing protein [Gammaproteobacteria bacterium]
MFEFLFTHPAEFFAQGTLILALPWWQFALLPLVILAPAFFVLGYFSLRGSTRLRDRMVIALLRSLAISLVLFSLSRPLLEVTAKTPQPNVVGILLDNSISMQVNDFAGAPRSELIRRQLDAESGSLLRALQQKFETHLFKFGASTQTLANIEALDYGDGDSNLGRALEIAQETLRGQPLAGLVVISDGAFQPNARLDSLLLALRAAQIPLHVIGVGQAAYPQDIEVSQVKLPHRVLKGSRVIADVTLTQQGYDGQTVNLVVEDDSRILLKQPLRLAPGRQSVKLTLPTEDSGARLLKFYLANQAGEQITANNQRQEMLAVNDVRMRILYYEGEPRFEMKFVRRAIADDKNLAVTGLIRTADAKYYRVGIESQQELRNGFPVTRAELFAYDALILGSVEISLLSREQQEMIVEFVSERGGGLLMLGGRHAFAEGGYRDSPLQAISPVVMAEQAQPDFSREIKIQPTAAAWVHPALLLADSNEKSIARWQTLPALTIVNPLRQIKPGATLLLTSSPEESEEPFVAMAFQRYGRGKVVAFPVQNSWLWQMHHDIELEDLTHELLWRQLLRWLVADVPPRLGLTLSTHRIHSGGSIRLRSELLQFGVDADEPPRLRAVLTAPTGLEQVRPLSRHPSLPGVYEAEIVGNEPGNYLLRVESEAQGEVIQSTESRFTVTRVGDEYHDSEMNEQLLRKLATATNGAFYSADETDSLADALATQQRGANMLVRHQLWNMPVIFLLLMLFLCSEWGYRRWRKLV